MNDFVSRVLGRNQPQIDFALLPFTSNQLINLIHVMNFGKVGAICVRGNTIHNGIRNRRFFIINVKLIAD